METVIVERDLPPGYGIAEVRANAERTQWCLDAHRVRRIRSYLGPGGKLVCVFEAPDVESVRLALAKSPVPAARVFRVTVHLPG